MKIPQFSCWEGSIRKGKSGAGYEEMRKDWRDQDDLLVPTRKTMSVSSFSSGSEGRESSITSIRWQELQRLFLQPEIGRSG